MLLPAANTPVSKFTIGFTNNQGGPCGYQYMDLFRCASRVGFYRVRYDCAKELADYQECFMKRKQNARVALMDAERKRQGRPPLEPLAKDIYDKEIW